MSPTRAPRAALAWWGATACWFLGSLLGRPAPAEAAVPGPVAVLAFTVAAGLFALLVYGVHRGVRGTRVALGVAGALGIADLVLQLARDAGEHDYVHGAFFLAALVLAVTGLVLLVKGR
ncbi:hypothetical protein [Amycolatopsis sp. cmx-4-68]|uniref:hypothetical protein n=1 Tax=Amycolatopsis sp. cmx-4-68 TaxID=2790938 RepID=UPI00397C3BCD